MKKYILAAAYLILAIVVFGFVAISSSPASRAAVTGPAGPAGPQGPDGPVIPAGCPGSEVAGAPAPGTTCPPVVKEPTYQCGSLPQSLCDKATGTIADPNNPLGGIRPLIDFIANIMVGLFGSIIVLIIIASGVQIAASGGNEEAVKKGKENIFKAVTGLVLLISFRAIIEIINQLFVGVDTGTLFDASGNLAAGGVPLIIKNAIGIASFFAGVVSVIFIIIGGIQYTTSGGGEGLKKAKKTITYAVAGLVISLSAYGILVFIQNQLQK